MRQFIARVLGRPRSQRYARAVGEVSGCDESAGVTVANPLSDYRLRYR